MSSSKRSEGKRREEKRKKRRERREEKEREKRGEKRGGDRGILLQKSRGCTYMCTHPPKHYFLLIQLNCEHCCWFLTRVFLRLTHLQRSSTKWPSAARFTDMQKNCENKALRINEQIEAKQALHSRQIILVLNCILSKSDIACLYLHVVPMSVWKKK